MEAAETGQLKSKCGVDRNGAQGSVVEQKTETMWLLIVELSEVVTAGRGWGLGGALNKWGTWGQWKQLRNALGYGGA